MRILVDKSRQWSILVWRHDDAAGTPFAGSLRVGIRAAVRQYHERDKGPQPPAEILATWTEIQAIKNQFWPHRLAVEIFPPARQLVDAAPMRWLWVLPVGATLPFNLQATDDCQPLQSWPDDAGPHDCKA